MGQEVLMNNDRVVNDCTMQRHASRLKNLHTNLIISGSRIPYDTYVPYVCSDARISSIPVMQAVRDSGPLLFSDAVYGIDYGKQEYRNYHKMCAGDNISVGVITMFLSAYGDDALTVFFWDFFEDSFYYSGAQSRSSVFMKKWRGYRRSFIDPERMAALYHFLSEEVCDMIEQFNKEKGDDGEY